MVLKKSLSESFELRFTICMIHNFMVCQLRICAAVFLIFLHIYIRTIFTKYPWHRDFNLCEVVSIFIPNNLQLKIKKHIFSCLETGVE